MPGEGVQLVVAGSAEEAAEAFGDGSGVTVLAGGTILVPELTYGRARPGKVLLLRPGGGLDAITRENGTVTIGAAVPVAALVGGDEPLSTAASHVADPEIRGQATVGGNVCAPGGADTPRGDLQGPLLALGARARSAGAGGERTEPLEDFLANREGRLLLDVSYDDVQRQAAYAAARRPHTHHYSILTVAAARTNGTTRIAATGLGPHAVLLDPDDPLAGVDPPDDALASGWYRRKILPSLVARALSNLS